ncbi:indole-3-glycerol-phosphate synthase [Planctomycetota bacterium]
MRPLDQILHAKRQELEQQRAAETLDELTRRINDSPPVADFRSAIHVEERLSLIAEIKRSSPSRGKIADIGVAELAQAYDNSSAAAISVLTDSHFEGAIEHISKAKSATSKPVLRKDFILDTYQVYQARAYGADAVLLIASILEGDKMAELLATCHELGLAALVESHTAEDVNKIPNNAVIFGVNNRDLSSEDLTIDMNTMPTVLPSIPQDKTIVCESGIHTREDVEKVETLERVNAILVGTSVIGSGDPQQKIAELLGI